MPNIGDIKKGCDIGRSQVRNFIWHACIDCGKERWVRYLRKQPHSLRCHSCNNRRRKWTPEQRARMSEGRRGNRGSNWGGGRNKNLGGYIEVYVYPDNFFYPMSFGHGKSGGRYILEHRLVIAQSLGRCLHSWEIVHHKGIRYKDIRNKSDNLIDNLQLVSDDRHKQITILEQKIKRLEVENKSLRKKLQL